MKDMKLYEPAMCCSTGLCGVSVDPELLRVSTVLNTLKQNGIEVQRFNLSNAPQEFVNNKAVNDFLKQYGPQMLPVTVVDGSIVLSGRYPSNAEFVKLLGVPAELLGVKADTATGSSCCSGGGCCCG